MSIVCPACGADYAGGNASGWVTCGSCNHIWNVDAKAGGSDRKGTEPMKNDTLQAIASDSDQEVLPASPAAAQPPKEATPSASPGRVVLPATGVQQPGKPKGSASDEYMPETGSTLRQDSSAALTGRHAPGAGVREALLHHQFDEPDAPPSKEVREGDSSNVNIDLFAQIEAQLENERSENRTMEVPDFGAAMEAEREAEQEGGLASPPLPPTAPHAAQIPPGEAEVERGPDPFIGIELGGCLIDRKLGEGGMGSVYHAKQLRLDRSVALKILPPEMTRNTKFLKRFEHEAKSLARINHPNILHIYDFGEDKKHQAYFMVMEFVDGQDMAELLRKHRRLGQAQVLDILLQAINGLEQAAAAGVVHRDIKPDNLMFTADGTCKVSDFGLAKDAAAMTQVTNMGVRVGTPAFMSPEQCDGENLDYRSDVYSLGVTAWVALTGSLPFSGESPFAIMLKHKTEPAPSVRNKVPEVDPKVDALVRQMMAKAPNERCASFADLQQQIERVLREITADESSDKHRIGTAIANEPPVGSFEASESGESLPPLPSALMDEHDRPVDQVVAPEPPPPASASPSASAPQPAFPEVSEAPAGGALSPSSPPVPSSPPSPPPASSSPRPPSSTLPAPPPAPASSSSSGIAAPTPPPSSTSGRRRLQSPSGVLASPRSKESARRRSVRGSGEQVAQPAPQASRIIHLEEEGDNLAAAGRIKEAIRSYQQAAQLSSQWKDRERIFKKVDALREKSSKKRRSLWSVITVVLLGGLYAAGWFATPMIHTALAESDLEQARAIGDDRQRLTALRRVVTTHDKPPMWAKIFLRTDYTVATVAVAQQEADRLHAAIQEAEGSQQVETALALFRAQVSDPAVSWSDLISTGEALLPRIEGAEAEEVGQALEAARQGLAQQDRSWKALMQATESGNLAAIHVISRELRRTGHLGERAGQVPVPQDMRVLSEKGEPVREFQIFADGREIKDFDGLLYRYPGKDLPLEISAPGFLRWTGVLPAGERNVDPFDCQLRHATAWQASADQVQVGAGKAVALLPIDLDQGYVLLHGPQAISLIQVSDGGARWRATPGDLLSHATAEVGWAPLLDISAKGVLVGTDQGDIMRVKVTGGGDRPVADRLYQLPAGAYAVEEYQIEMLNQAAAMSAVELRDGHFVYVTRYQDEEKVSRPLEAQPGQPPVLFGRRRDLYVLDDVALHRFDYQGESTGQRSLPGDARRRGPSAWVGSAEVLVVPIDGALLAIDFSVVGDPMAIHKQRFDLADKQVMQLVGRDGRNAVLLTSDGNLRLIGWQNDAWKEEWTLKFSQRKVDRARVWMNQRYIVMADGEGVVVVLNRDDGKRLFTYDHDRPVEAMCIVSGRLLIYDAQQSLTAYELVD